MGHPEVWQAWMFLCGMTLLVAEVPGWHFCHPGTQDHKGQPSMESLLMLLLGHEREHLLVLFWGMGLGMWGDMMHQYLLGP